MPNACVYSLRNELAPNLTNPVIQTTIDGGRSLHAARTRYATEFALNVLGRPRVDLPSAMTELIADSLSRKEEKESDARDQWGNWDYQFSERARTDAAVTPWVDELLLAHQGPLPARDDGTRSTIWPRGHGFALCLTHDVDVVSSRGHASRFFRRIRRVVTATGPRRVAALLAAGSLYRLATGLGGRDELGRFEEWVNLEARYGFRSTWYFLPSSYSRAHVYDMEYRHDDAVIFRGKGISVSEMMRALDATGCEVGLHGSYLSARDVSMLRDQREQVERAVRQPVRSVRQHYLCYDAATTPSVQAQAGLLCDSTQGFNTNIGFRAGTSYPYRAWDWTAGQQSSVLEIPMQLMDAALLGAMGLPVSEATRRSLEIMDAVERVGGCLTLNWHPNYINKAPYMAVYATLLEEASRRNAWGCSAGQLYDWWTDRERCLQDAARDSDENGRAAAVSSA